LRSGLLQLRTDRLTGDRLVGADVGERTELLVPGGAGVDGDDRDPGRDRVLDRGLQRVGVGHRDHESVDLLVDRRVDQLRLLLRVAVALVHDGVAHVFAGLLRAVLDDAPERVTGRAMRDDSYLEAVLSGAAAGLVLGGRLVHRVAARTGREENHGRGEDDEPR